MTLFGFFSLILVMVYWINRAVVLFDQLIADGQSATVFLEFTALSLPAVVRIALPLAAFAASVYVTNRMINESELVVVQATGFSPYRLARPFLYFGLIVAVMISILMHVLVPISTARLNDRTAELAQNVGARLLTEGQFIEPVKGVTLYIREITPAGELRDIFLSDLRDEQRQITYTAAQAFLVKTDDDAQLVMVNGLAQTLQSSSGTLFTTAFEDFTYNIGSLLEVPQNNDRKSSELSTAELLWPTQALSEETGRSKARLISDGHDRFGQSFLGLIGGMLGFAALLIGGHSRFGVWRQIVLAIFLIILIKAFETIGLGMARTDATLWFAAYFSTISGVVVIFVLLLIADQPKLIRRKRRVAT